MSVLVYFNKFTIISYVLSSNEQFHTNDPNINDLMIPITGNFALTYLNDISSVLKNSDNHFNI